MPVRKLPKELKECSGMTALNNNTMVAVNDGGDNPVLYTFELNNDHEARKVIVDGAVNNDWEELTTDNQFVYIGDTGNNGGTRRNLVIYKISKNELLTKTHVTAQKIMFSYQGQTKFNDSNRHNFDCEALISVRDSLFLFTKNRGDHKTDVYGIPKIPGTYIVRKFASFDAKGLITGADYKDDRAGQELVLIGYNISGHVYHPFLIHFTHFIGTNFFSGAAEKIIPDQDNLQGESVLLIGEHKVYISNEETKAKKGYVFELTL